MVTEIDWKDDDSYAIVKLTGKDKYTNKKQNKQV